MRLLACVALFTMGCIPHRATVRPEIDGVVVDAGAKAVAGAYVESCTASHWNSACRYRATQVTDALGRFHLDARKEWDSCCLGEAPRPYTILAACTKDGRVASARIEGASVLTEPLVLGTDAEPWAKQACSTAFEP